MLKKSDRIQVMADGLNITTGIDAKPTPDGMVIQGGLMGGVAKLSVKNVTGFNHFSAIFLLLPLYNPSN